MNQALALEIMLDGQNVFLTGAAGSGKTFLLNNFIKLAKKSGKKVSVTATTGLAATHLGGNTIHAWSGIGISDYLSPKMLEKMSKTRFEIIKNTDILIIDEISMLHDFRLDMVDQICRFVKENDKPFGGIQIVLCGDFFQLPPINRADGRSGGFAINAEAWSAAKFAVCYLEDNFRQNDDELAEILNAMRSGDLRRHHAEKLLDRTNFEGVAAEGLTELHTLNIDVDKINDLRLAEIDGTEMSYVQTTTGAKNYVETLQKSVLAPPLLRLKKGALVMAVKNSQNRQFFNGSIGRVVDFEPFSDYPVVEFGNGKIVTMVPDSWELRDGEKKRASIMQIPLRLAYAITVHKSQGMTLDSAIIDLRKAFAEGMGYVALSRVRSLDKIFLKGINRTALVMSDEARSIDLCLRQQSQVAENRFASLLNRSRANSSLLEKSGNKPKTSWAERLEKMREKHPNAYKPWRNSEDAELKQLFLQGVGIEELSKKFGRHKNSIKIRLQKHFGEDAIL